ncbi:MAG: peroxiredoxin family protein [Planctomycetota bacterium]
MISLAFAVSVALSPPSPALLAPPQAAPQADQDPVAASRYRALVREADAANLAWGERVAALRKAELQGGDPVPAEAWTSPLVPFVPRFEAAARDFAGGPDAIPFLKWITKNAMPMQGAGRASAKAALHELVTTHRASDTLEELSWALGRMVYFFGEEEGLAIAAALEQTSPNAKVRTWAVFSRTSGALENAPVDSDSYRDALEEVRAALAKVELPMLEQEVENRVAVRAKFSLGMVAPDIDGVDLQGEAFKLSDYRGKVVLVDFWADW